MAPEHLPEDLKLAGQRLLEATDTLGLEAQGATWIYEPDLEEWRYYLVTVLLDSEGPTWVYKRLMEAFSKPPERDDFNIIDVHLGSPNEIVFRILRDRMTTKSGSHYTEIIGLTLGTVIDGIEYSLESPHIIVYRMVSAPEPAEVARVRRQFSRKVRELIAS